MNLFKNLSEKEEYDIELFLQKANVILNVTNSIGNIRIKEFESYVKAAHCHWISAFGQYRKIKSSIHWSLGHIIELLCKNNCQSLAEKSGNSLEAAIKNYRYITSHCARHSSFAENCADCLKVLNILSLQRVRKFNLREKTEFPLKDNEESKLIRSFFQNGNSENLIDMKWDTSSFEQTSCFSS